MSKKKIESGGEIITAESMQKKIYYIRGQRVMLDYDLARIYGYTTSAFNQQILRNLNKFDDDFMFRLSDGEYSVLKSQIVISKNKHGGDRHLPYAFTEQGIYMLMTVLNGELAVMQSKTLIRMFKSMKDYILESQGQIEYRSNLQMALKIADNAKDIEKVKSELGKLDTEIKMINQRLGNVIMKSDISPIILDFSKLREQKTFLFLDNQLAKASETYIELYSKAKKNIYIIDNYISLKTLNHLCQIKPGVKVIIYTDNLGGYLHKIDYDDFVREFPHVSIKFIRTNNQVHDRFIVLDYGEDTEMIYHAGASEKDAGNKVAMISRFNDELVRKALHVVVDRLMMNMELKLK